MNNWERHEAIKAAAQAVVERNWEDIQTMYKRKMAGWPAAWYAILEDCADEVQAATGGCGMDAARRNVGKIVARKMRK